MTGSNRRPLTPRSRAARAAAMQAPVIQPRRSFAISTLGPRGRHGSRHKLGTMADTLPTTPERAASGIAAALYADAQGALGVPKATAGIGGLSNAATPAMHRDVNSAATPCQHNIETALAGLGRTPPAPSPPPW